jgi:hypothetical protein
MTYTPKNREELRQSIADICGEVIIGECTSNGSTTTVIDSQNLYGGADDYKGQEILMTSGDAEGDKSRVIDYNPVSHKLTLSPALSNATADGDTYELHSKFTVNRINNAINLAIVGISDEAYSPKVDDSTLVKLKNNYLYTISSDFEAIHTLEYEKSTKIKHTIHECDVAWDELTDADVTVSVETDLRSGCQKFVVADGCGAGDILATDSITSIDINDCNVLRAWVYSTKDLDAGDYQILLDDTAECESPLEELDLPAITAYTGTWITIDLANPSSDVGIVSVGVKMVKDKGEHTFYIDSITAEHSASRIYSELNPNAWYIVQGSTSKIQLSEGAYSTIGNDKILKLHGYQLISELSDDSTDAEVDPDYIIARAVADLLSSDPDKDKEVKYWATLAEAKKRDARTPLEQNTRFIL